MHTLSFITVTASWHPRKASLSPSSRPCHQQDLLTTKMHGPSRAPSLLPCTTHHHELPSQRKSQMLVEKPRRRQRPFSRPHPSARPPPSKLLQRYSSPRGARLDPRKCSNRHGQVAARSVATRSHGATNQRAARQATSDPSWTRPAAMECLRRTRSSSHGASRTSIPSGTQKREKPFQ